jgi:diacylglycerol kinase (ATP)
MKVFLLVNPKARGRGNVRAINVALERFAMAGWAVITVRTGSTDHASEVIRAAPADGFDLLIVAGGDGTVHNAVQHLPLGFPTHPSPLPLGIIPLGSGNDFYRGIGAPSDPLGAGENLVNGRPMPVDIGVVEPINEDGSLRDEPPIRFVNSAGIGIDSRTLATRLKAPRWLSDRYDLLFLLTLIWMKPMNYRLKAESWERNFPGYWVLCCNNGQIGTGMKIAPEARFDDGMLDVVTVERIPKWRFVRNLPKVFKGTHTDEKGFDVVKAKEVIVRSIPTVRVAADGDLVFRTPVRIRVLPGALTLWTSRLGGSE